MKAYQILLFMFIFNMVFWTVTIGLSFFDVSASPNPKFEIVTDNRDPSLGLIDSLSMFGTGVTIIVMAGTIVTGAVVGYLTAGQGAQGAVYALFIFFFWSSMGNTLTVFYNIAAGNASILYILAIFTMIIGVVFAAGLFQMVTGGWKAHE